MVHQVIKFRGVEQIERCDVLDLPDGLDCVGWHFYFNHRQMRDHLHASECDYYGSNTRSHRHRDQEIDAY